MSHMGLHRKEGEEREENKMKICSCCKRNLNMFYFGYNKASKDGRAFVCKECSNKINRIRNAKAVENLAFSQKELLEMQKGLKELAKQRVSENKIYPYWFSYDSRVFAKNKARIEELKNNV